MAEIAEGATFPDIEVTRMNAEGKPGFREQIVSNSLEKVGTHALFKGKKVVLFAIPGAFTPTCTSTHCPSFTRDADRLKQKGVELVACTAVNDVFVMVFKKHSLLTRQDAFEDYLKARGKIVFLGECK